LSLIDWIRNIFKGDSKQVNISEYIGKLATEVYYKELAIEACANLIAGVFTKAEFQTFENGQETRKDNYYAFNVRPNPNKNAAAFWRDVVRRMVRDGHSLVLQVGDNFYVAESFQVEKKAFFDYRFSGIRIDDFQLDRSYDQREVFYFEYQNPKMRALIDGLYNSYGKLIAASQKQYIRNLSRRGIVEIDASVPETQDMQNKLRDLMENRFKSFFEAEGDAVLPLYKGLHYQELEKAQGAQSRSSQEAREIRAFIDDIFDFVAIAMNVPPQLLKGNVADTEKAMDNFLTFCINPIAEIIQDELNGKYYKKRNYLDRTYVKVNTSMIRAHDIKDIAGALEILLRIGGYSIDDILKALGMEPLNTEWSTIKWMTKNYAPAEQVATGGDVS